MKLTSRAALVLSLGLLTLGACSSTPGLRSSGPKTEVLVLGMIHSGHRTSETYGLEQLSQILRAAQPDAVLTEIPPDRLRQAAKEFAETGVITEPRVRVFPEYVDVLFPLQAELGFDIVPCAGWTREMAQARRAKLKELSETHPEEDAMVSEGFDYIDSVLAREKLSSTPHGIHTDRYDEVVELGMTPYDVHFNDALGAGGWSNINDAHWSLCAQELNRRRGSGDRVVITFGSWHKGRLREALAKRSDCVEIDAGAVILEALGPPR